MGIDIRLGIIVRTDNTGLGYQTRALQKMLNPKNVMYLGKDEMPIYEDFQRLFDGIDVMITCETPYIYEAWNWAREAGVKTICQPNWEFFDGLVQPNMPHPDQYIMPSYWHLEDFQKMFPKTIYLPPPTLPFKKKHGLKTTRRFVHIIGSNAIYDRNGWVSIMDALSLTKSDFELVVYSQQEMTGYSDPRVKYHVGNVEDQEELYLNFDALILPRRYGGLCLPMNEALTAGLPVIMTDISPNNKVLPDEWLLPAYQSASFEGRSTIDVHSVDPTQLAQLIDDWCEMSDEELLFYKETALELGKQYSFGVLRPKYMKLLTDMLA